MEALSCISGLVKRNDSERKTKSLQRKIPKGLRILNKCKRFKNLLLRFKKEKEGFGLVVYDNGISLQRTLPKHGGFACVTMIGEKGLSVTPVRFAPLRFAPLRFALSVNIPLRFA